MDVNSVKATIYLQAVLASLEDIVADDSEARALTAGWNCVLRFHVGGSELGSRLVFSDGALNVEPGAGTGGTVGLRFPSPEAVIATFGGGGEKKKPHLSGWWHVGLLKRTPALLKRMQHYLRPSEETLADPAARALLAKILLHVVARSTVIVGNLDPATNQGLKDLPEGTLQWIVQPDGPAARIISSGGTLSFAKGPSAEPPAAQMRFKDIDCALAFLSGRTDPMKAIVNGEVVFEGPTTLLAQKLLLAMSAAGKFLQTPKKEK